MSDSEGKRPSGTARLTRTVVGRDTTHHYTGFIRELPEGLQDRHFVEVKQKRPTAWRETTAIENAEAHPNECFKAGMSMVKASDSKAHT
jgi:hypothetical protein